MFRATPCVFHIRKLFYTHKPLLDHHIASITHFSPLHAKKITPGDPRLREPCPQPPPPPPKPPKDDKWIWLTLTALFIGGIGIVTAKGSPEIRDWLTLYAPFVDDFIAVLYEENYTYGEMAVQCVDSVKEYIAELTGEKKVKECSTEAKPVEDVVKEAVKKELEALLPAEVEDDGEEVCVPPVPPVVTQDICDIEACIKELSEFVINNYDTAKEICSYYNSLVDETMETFTIKGMKKLRYAKKERKGLVKESLKNAKQAISRLDEMYRYLDCGVQATKEEIENTKLLQRNYRQMYKAARVKYEWANDIALAKDRQWQIVEAVVDKYVDEVQALCPGLKYAAKRPQLEGNPDFVLYSAYRYINHLNDELDTAVVGLSERINRAYDSLPSNKEAMDARAKLLQSTLTAKTAELVKEFNDRYAAQKANNDKLLQTLIKKQLAKHEELLSKKLAQKEAEVKSKMDGMVRAAVEKEKRLMEAQLADMRQKLAVVEAKLEVRLKAERETRRSQALWAAATALLIATKRGGDHIDISKELNAIEKASDGEDNLVLTVLKSIPESVREHGIVPETKLKEKYKIMEDIALKVALVEEDGGAMPVYILSWLQAILLFMKVNGIPQHEFEKPPKEPQEYLDTFDLLQRARFWINRGDLAQALRYVNSLKGASRLAAHQWYESARAHLEVRQAAEAVLAHAAALGLQYI